MPKRATRHVFVVLAALLFVIVGSQAGAQSRLKAEAAVNLAEGPQPPSANVAATPASSDTPDTLPGFELLATLEGRVTERVSYGTTPTRGYRSDVHFEGRLQGKINGAMKGIDYVLEREDFAELNVRGMIKTDDEALISVEITGFWFPGGEIRDLMVKFQTGSPRYQWLHQKIVVGKGTSIGDKLIVKYYYLP